MNLIAIVVTVAIVFSACRKINEATELGSGLIPPIDNINTFETYLNIETDNKLFNDTTKVYFNDDLAIGHISNDPEFGITHSDAYFNISPTILGTYPFFNKDSIVGVDSVVLSLAYSSSYGDTNTFKTIRVFEIAQNGGFNDTTLYKYNHPDFLTTGGQLGFKTYQSKALKDSIQIIRKRDTSYLTNVIRVPLSSTLGVRLTGYDTTNTANGGYRTDSIFKNLFRGFAVKADNSGNSLDYFSPTNANTRLIVYYRVKKNGTIDTTSTDFYHQTQGQASLVRRTPGANWNTYLTNGISNDDKLYLPTIPGSYGELKIPGLDTFRNSVIHRAEIVVTPLPSLQENIFGYPLGLFLDRINNAGDTVYTFDNDMQINFTGNSYSYDIAAFGGLLKTDSTIRFNISRYVQNIITTKSRNFTLRLYVPVRAFVYSPGFNLTNQIFVTDRPAYGRIVVGGGSFINPAKRMRLRIIYSKL